MAQGQEDWRPIATAPVAARVEALTARGQEITGRTMGRGTRGQRGNNMVETSDGFRHVCTHWRPLSHARNAAVVEGERIASKGIF